MTDIISNGYLTSVGRPYMVFDNMFSEDVVSDLLLEIDFFARPAMRKEKTGGTNKKDAMAIFLHEIFANPNVSSVYRNTRRYMSADMLGMMKDFHWWFDAVDGIQLQEGIQILYYENGDTYGKHKDHSVMTVLYWLCKDPKGFEGGDLILDGDSVVEFKNNRAVVMPMQMPHEVTAVKSTTEKDGYGRYCISNFYMLAPYNKEQASRGR